MKRIAYIIPLLIVLVGCGQSTAESESITETNESAVKTESSSIQSQVNGITVGDYVELERPPYYYQNAYSDVPYGNKTIATNGNLITVLSMLESYYMQQEITPDQFLERHKDEYTDGIITHDEISGIIEGYGMACESGPFNLRDAADAMARLKAMVIVYIPHNSVYSKGGCYLLLTERSKNGLVVHDPMYENRDVFGTEYNGEIVYDVNILDAQASE